ncbi:hypothetical protein ACIBHX_46790 [Nonomuraea sp. NPDC050536]|uniref:hypothetical protein n=1 Tax=Nonomuraea sp. NPDC050536 TaxID=3364366 RepID=UPI0037C673B2
MDRDPDGAGYRARHGRRAEPGTDQPPRLRPADVAAEPAVVARLRGQAVALRHLAVSVRQVAGPLGELLEARPDRRG